MNLTRRKFLALSGVSTIGLAASFSAIDLTPVYAYCGGNKLQGAKESTTICPYCGVGCGLIVAAKGGKVINIEGDPDHPINEGSLCSKGSALYQVANNEHRLRKVLYRAPYSDKWMEKDWDWALDRIAAKVKKTRDASFVEKKNGVTVNRTEGIACLGGAALDSEECYTLSKLMRALGLVYIEHQARI